MNQLTAETIELSDGVATCGTSLTTNGQRNRHCQLAFTYRSPAAQAAFEGLVSQMAACLGPDAQMSTDQSVNHPDWFELREFELDGRSYAVSIKDKGALQQTLVFVRVSHP